MYTLNTKMKFEVSYKKRISRKKDTFSTRYPPKFTSLRPHPRFPEFRQRLVTHLSTRCNCLLCHAILRFTQLPAFRPTRYKPILIISPPDFFFAECSEELKKQRAHCKYIRLLINHSPALIFFRSLQAFGSKPVFAISFTTGFFLKKSMSQSIVLCSTKSYIILPS